MIESASLRDYYYNRSSINMETEFFDNYQNQQANVGKQEEEATSGKVSASTSEDSKSSSRREEDGGEGDDDMANRQRKSERDESLQKDDAEERKKRRMLSNRESARRSRLRKQQHLDDLRSHVTQMRSEKSEMLARFSLTSRQLAQISTENQSLHSQAMELQAKLHELIVLSSSASSTSASDSFHHRDQ